MDDIPDCHEIKEYKCRPISKGYKTEEDCKEWPVQKCSVKSEWVKKVTPETKCHKVPKKLCAPTGCGFVQGPEQCFDKKETVIEDVRNYSIITASYFITFILGSRGDMRPDTQKAM